MLKITTKPTEKREEHSEDWRLQCSEAVISIEATTTS